MGDGAKLAAAVVGLLLVLNQCENGDAVSNARLGAGAAAVGVGVGAGVAAGSAASGAAKGLGKRAEDRVSGRNRPRPIPTTTAVPNGPSRPLPPPVTTAPMVEDFDLCTVIVDMPGCVVTK